MLTIRRRGKNFHVRGSIRVGRETRISKSILSERIAETMQRRIDQSSKPSSDTKSFTVVEGGRTR